MKKNRIFEGAPYWAENIKAIREVYGYNQAYMAKKLNVSQPVYSHLEKGEHDPCEEKIIKIATILNIPVPVLKIASRRPPLENLEYLIKLFNKRIQ
jgi:transcriptional regulator with XRE-family HTH domain